MARLIYRTYSKGRGVRRFIFQSFGEIAMTDIAVSIRGLRQGYGKQDVIDDVSLEIPRGQTFALLGRNGAGKTTLIRTLLGLLRPHGGDVSVLGLNPATDAVEVRRRIGYLAEDQAV